MHDLLGYAFVAARTHWGEHLATLGDFWSWQLLGEHGDVGQPLRVHETVHARTPFTTAYVERWPQVFIGTIESFRGPVAEQAKTRACKLASALRGMHRLLRGIADPDNAPGLGTWVADSAANVGGTRATEHTFPIAATAAQADSDLA